MRERIKMIVTFTFAAAVVLGIVSATNAQKRNDREIRDVVRSLNSGIDDLDYTLTYQLKANSASRDTVNESADHLRGLRNSVREFQSNFDLKRENKNDADRIVQSGKAIGRFLAQNPQNRHISDIWNGIRKDIDRMGAIYGISPDWDIEPEPQAVEDHPDSIPGSTIVVGLTGTYSLDTAKSETFEDAAGNIVLTADQRDDLKDKLTAPSQLAIDVRGSRVTLASTNASPVTIYADGSEKTETDGNGATVRLRAKLDGPTLTVSSVGGETDYTITFTSDDNGRVLKVSRRITTAYLKQTVFSESTYNKSDQIARLGIDTSGNGTADNDQSNGRNGGYSDNDQNVTPVNGGSTPNQGNTRSGANPNYGSVPRVTTNRTGDFIVPNGVTLTGSLDNDLDTAVSQNNDRIRILVKSPSEFNGATIEGYVTSVARSGRVLGRSNITFNFEKITLADGKTYDFAGFLQSVTDTNGKMITVDQEGSAKGSNQTNQTAKRGAIGAGLGALIGLIAGGGNGAAIGAIIGGGAGAGSVVVQGRDDLQLKRGSSITIQSTSPIRSGQNDR